MSKCYKEEYGMCCCTCKNHLEDFYHCTTSPKPEGVEGCVCSVHKGWICKMMFEGGVGRCHSGWSEHGMCEMWISKDPQV